MSLPFWLDLPKTFEYYVWNVDTCVTRPITTLATVVRDCGLNSTCLERLIFGPFQNYYDLPCFKIKPQMSTVRLIPKRNPEGYTLWNVNEEFAPYHTKMRFRRYHLPIPLSDRKDLINPSDLDS